MAAIGFVGLGTMGKPIATRLLEAKHDLIVYDLRQSAIKALTEEGATEASGYAEVGKYSEVVFLSLPGPEAVEEAITGGSEYKGLIAGLSPGNVVIDLSTSSPQTTKRLAQDLADRDITILGAPVSGGLEGARAGTLSIMVGGENAVVDACCPIFDSFASNIFHVGEQPAHGHAMKLLNNYLSMGALFLTSEAVILGESAGLDSEVMIDVFNASTGRNSATERKFPNHILSGTYDTGFPLKLVRKDLDLLIKFSQQFETPLLLGGVVNHFASFAHNTQGDDADQTRFYDFLNQIT